MRTRLSFFLLLVSVIGYSQSEEIVFFNSKWKTVVSKSRCKYYRVIKYSEDGKILMPVKDYYCKNDNLQAEFYSDKVNIQGIKYGSSIEKMGIYNGKAIIYSENGEKEILYFDKGNLTSRIKLNNSNKIDLTDKFDKFIVKENLYQRNKIISKFIRDLSGSLVKLKKKNPSKEHIYDDVLNRLKSDANLTSKIIVYSFQRNPKQVVDLFLSSFKNSDYSVLLNLIDPYGKTSRDTQELLLMMYYLEPILKEDLKRLPNMLKQMNYNIIDYSIEDNKASVKIDTEVKGKNVKSTVRLIQRHGYWFLL